MIKNKKLLKVTATGLAILTSISAGVVVIKLMKKSPYEYEEITTSYSSSFDEDNITEDITELTTEPIIFEDIDEEPTTIKTVTEPTTKKVVEETKEEEQDLTDYNALKQRMSDVLSKKRYDENTKEILNIIVDKLYFNYDSVQGIYNNDGMRDKNTYINDFIDTIEKNVNDIVYANSGSRDIYAMKLGTNKAVYSYLDKRVIIDSRVTYEELVSVCLHEITHSQQLKILNDRKVPNGMRYVLVEGEAAASSIFLDSNMPFFSKLVISSEDNNLSYVISGLSDTDYAAYSRYYMMLGHMAGFDTLQELKRSGYNEELLVKAIESRYNIDGKKFIDDVDTAASIISRTYYSDPLMESAGNIEKNFMSVLSYDLENANSKESLKEFMNMYRHYKLQYKMIAYNNNFNYIENAFGELDIEKKLYNKLLQYEVLPSGIEYELFNLIMFNYSDYNSYYVKDYSIYELRYSADDNQIILIGKTCEDMMIYDLKTKKVTNDTATKEIYNSCNYVISKDSLVKSR